MNNLNSDLNTLPLLGSVIDNRPSLVGISARTLLVIMRVGSWMNGGVSILIKLIRSSVDENCLH